MTITLTYLGLLIFSAVCAIGGLLIGKWIWEKERNKVTINEKHELTLSFNSSEELWEFAKKYKDNIVSVSDYKIYTCATEPQTTQVESEE